VHPLSKSTSPEEVAIRKIVEVALCGAVKTLAPFCNRGFENPAEMEHGFLSSVWLVTEDDVRNETAVFVD